MKEFMAKKWFLLFSVFLILLIFGLLFFRSDLPYRLFVVELSGAPCYAISENDAKLMINRIFAEKMKRSSNGLILFNLNPKDLIASSVSTSEGIKGDDSYFMDIEYSDRNTKVPLLKASIYESCDVQWINLNQTKTNDPNDMRD
jgi:hypothetical protein